MIHRRGDRLLIDVDLDEIVVKLADVAAEVDAGLRHLPVEVGQRRARLIQSLDGRVEGSLGDERGNAPGDPVGRESCNETGLPLEGG